MRAEDSAGFGYEYFDDPHGLGYRGYHREDNGDGGYLPWQAAREFCEHRKVRSAVDLGCAKGFLVAELLAAGIDAVGYDVSDYALSFATGLPCHRADIRRGIPRRAEAVFALGVLLYLEEDELPGVLARLRRAARRFLLFSSYYEGEEQEVPDPLRRITRPREWWRAQLTDAGFTFDHTGQCFDIYTV
ncbi:class I SAM-dependent methyltransferase [Streptomyces sp. YIM 98790]|uniref:class I SAM-dependent methyltransferase n=1 Tax=Streptomyces sp. YIM 98790 TaxID=2689077 RepID=UPI00140E86D5|nr:class I SAM-dependent methyltransferase [Streptomyces sp. YIM 98790]